MIQAPKGGGQKHQEALCYVVLTSNMLPGYFIHSLGTLPPGSNHVLVKSWDFSARCQGLCILRPLQEPHGTCTAPGAKQTSKHKPCQLGAYTRQFKAA